MLKGKFIRTNLTHAARNWAFTIKTSTGAPSGITSAGSGYCYNSADDKWYMYSVLHSDWYQIG